MIAATLLVGNACIHMQVRLSHACKSLSTHLQTQLIMQRSTKRACGCLQVQAAARPSPAPLCGGQYRNALARAPSMHALHAHLVPAPRRVPRTNAGDSKCCLTLLTSPPGQRDVRAQRLSKSQHTYLWAAAAEKKPCTTRRAHPAI